MNLINIVFFNNLYVFLRRITGPTAIADNGITRPMPRITVQLHTF